MRRRMKQAPKRWRRSRFEFRAYDLLTFTGDGMGRIIEIEAILSDLYVKHRMVPTSMVLDRDRKDSLTRAVLMGGDQRTAIVVATRPLQVNAYRSPFAADGLMRIDFVGNMGTVAMFCEAPR